MKRFYVLLCLVIISLSTANVALAARGKEIKVINNCGDPISVDVIGSIKPKCNYSKMRYVRNNSASSFKNFPNQCLGSVVAVPIIGVPSKVGKINFTGKHNKHLKGYSFEYDAIPGQLGSCHLAKQSSLIQKGAS